MKHTQKKTSTETESVSTYADLIINYLQKLDVDYVFGVPGGAIEPLYNALARHMRTPSTTDKINNDSSIIPLRKTRNSQGIKAIIARHEAGAAFMAEGYARETGKLAVCCATTGPGATNLITGVASAYTDRIPMLVITPQTALPDFGKLGQQESSSEAVDTVGMFEHCTRYNTLVSHPSQLEGKLYTALINAYRHPRGPVHLSIPMDILRTKIDSHSNGYQVAHLFRQPEMVDEVAYNALIQEMSTAKKIVLLLGSGCKNAAANITELAERINAEITTTPCGKNWINSYHSQYRGVFGFASHSSAHEAIMAKDVDLIVAVGTSLGELSTSGWNKSLLNNKLIHISEVADDFSRSPMAKLHLVGDLKTIFKNLNNDLSVIQNLNGKPNDNLKLVDNKTKQEKLDDYLPKSLKVREPDKCYSDAVPLKPQRIMRELAQRFPQESRFLADAGNSWSWSIQYLLQRSVGNHRFSLSFGAMGWAIGAAVGTSLSHLHLEKKPPVICITGDGSFLMSGQEITVALQHQLPTIFVILNDSNLGMIKHGQRLAGAERIGFELPPVDFAMMAKAMGANGHTIKTPEDFAKLDIAAICGDNKPTLLDIHVDPEEVPPIGSRIRSLNSHNTD